MRKILIYLSFVLFPVLSYAQAPQGFNYQSVIRDSDGEIIANSPIGLRISILRGSTTGTVSYSETHFPTTNQFGLISITIGSGTPFSGQFDTIAWGGDEYFIKTEMDINGGANFQLMGINQLISVPYALYGRDEDYDTINELQTIQLVNDTIILSNDGGFIPIKDFDNIGEVKMFAVSISGAVTISHLRSKGWAVCDGSTPVSQGISNPILSTTPNLSNKFICMSDDETSGTTGGVSEHNHQWLLNSSRTMGYVTSSGGGTNQVGKSFNADGNVSGYPSYTGSKGYIDGDYYTNKTSNMPPYYELLFFIKVR